MALPQTDDFNRANGAPGGIWTQITGENAAEIFSNQIRPLAVGNDAGYYDGSNSYAQDQYAQVQVITASAATVNFVSAVVRVQAGARQFYSAGVYGAIGGTVTYEIFKRDGATRTSLKTGSTAVNTLDLIRVEATGGSPTTLTLKINGTVIDSVADASTPFTAGFAGFYLFVDSGVQADATLDNFEGGNVSGGGGTLLTGFGRRLQGFSYS